MVQTQRSPSVASQHCAFCLVQAVETVLAANPGSAAVDAILERENNMLVWEVELDNDLELYMKANTNQIVKTKQNWDFTDIAFLGRWIPS